MNKIRIYELAKELGLSSKELINKAAELKINVTNHMSTLEDEEVKTIKNVLRNKSTEAVKKDEPKEVKKTDTQKPSTKEEVKTKPQQPAVKEEAKVKPQQTADNKGAKKEAPKDISKARQEVTVNNKPRPDGGNAFNNKPKQNNFNAFNNNQNRTPAKPEIKQDVSSAKTFIEDEDIKVGSNKEDNKKVERIGKKVNNKPGQSGNKQPFGKQQGNRNNFNRNFKGNKHHSGNIPVKKEEPIVSKKPIKIGDSISVKELGEKLGKQATEIIKKLLMLGVMATINQELDYETAAVIIEDFGMQVEKQIDKTSEEVLLRKEEDRPEDLMFRPPVVTIMGHVDHGKTSLLDAIRETNVIATEAGGITQHIGAYTVNVDNGKKVCFLDTPGHEAFTAMRARGAKVTDIAILVVAADDGIMPQTVEAINHAKAANVPIIVAINKIDKVGANPDKIKQELTEYGLVSEEWGGETICVPVSAKKKEGIDHLLEMILLVAEMQELRANPNKKAKGTVVEAKLDKARGPIATVLVQEGTLNLGDAFVVGSTSGRIRAMLDDKGKKIKKAGPSTPVELLGLSEVPDAGDVFNVMDDEKVARQIAEKRKEKQRQAQMQSSQKISLDDLFSQIKEGKVKDLNLIVKADVQGSVEAMKQSLNKLSNEEVKVNTIHGGVGAITESDIMLASASNAIIIGFNVRPQPAAIALAEKDNVDIRLYRVIYNAIEDVEAAMKGMLEPEYKEVVQGHAEIRATFKVSSIGTIAGCYVTDGKINRNDSIRLIRDGIVIHEGTLASLKRFKDDVKEVSSGYECGLNIERFNDIKEGDIVESFKIEAVPRK
ncbi:MAG: translation initiation factor IF-2 [Bacillota bacterium]